MDIFDRIQYVVENNANRDLAEFARVINVKYETLRGSLKYKKSKPGYDVLKSIIEHIEWVNPDWLMTGRGEPFKKDDKSKEVQMYDVPVTMSEPVAIYLKKEDRLLSIIESQQRTIESQQKSIENLSSKDLKNIAGSA